MVHRGGHSKSHSTSSRHSSKSNIKHRIQHKNSSKINRGSSSKYNSNNNAKHTTSHKHNEIIRVPATHLTEEYISDYMRELLSLGHKIEDIRTSLRENGCSNVLIHEAEKILKHGKRIDRTKISDENSEDLSEAVLSETSNGLRADLGENIEDNVEVQKKKTSFFSWLKPKKTSGEISVESFEYSNALTQNSQKSPLNLFKNPSYSKSSVDSIGSKLDSALENEEGKDEEETDDTKEVFVNQNKVTNKFTNKVGNKIEKSVENEDDLIFAGQEDKAEKVQVSQKKTDGKKIISVRDRVKTKTKNLTILDDTYLNNLKSQKISQTKTAEQIIEEAKQIDEENSGVERDLELKSEENRVIEEGEVQKDTKKSWLSWMLPKKKEEIKTQEGERVFGEGYEFRLPPREEEHIIFSGKKKHHAPIAVLLIVAITFGALFFLVFGVNEDCGSDTSCFVGYATGCDSSTFLKDFSGTKVKFTIEGCMLTKEIVDFAPNEPYEVVQTFSGKSMSCPIRKGSFELRHIEDISFTQGCSGSLKSLVDEFKSA